MLVFVSIVVSLAHKFALGLGLGAATIALSLFVQGHQDGGDTSEARFMGRVSFMLRIALALIIAAQIVFLSSVPSNQLSNLFSEPVFVVGWVMILVMIVTATSAHLKKIPGWLAAILSGGSWYALFTLHAWPARVPLNILELTGIYVAFLVVFGGVLLALQRRFRPTVTIVPTP